MNEYNETLLEQGKKRRANLLRLHMSGKTVKQIAQELQVSGARVRWMLQKARKESTP